MITSLQDTTILHNGVKMPWFGLGVFKVQEGSEVIESVKAAINHGYISIDTAAIYQNEEGVGTGIRESDIPREKLFVTSKVWNTDQGYDTTLKAFDLSLQKLGLDYLDLYLIHWPGKDKYKETWKALEKLYKDGRVRAIGVSNFLIHHLQDLISEAEIIPMVNQVEYHPHLTQKELHAFCKQHQIQLEAWSPLKRGALLNEPLLTEVAAKYGKSVAQLILRWDLQNQVITIPKSIKPERIIENADIFDFEISADDMKKIDGLNIDDRSGSHPDQMEVGFTS